MIDRLGRRGLVLALFGLAWVIQGVAVFLLGGMTSGAESPILHERLPDVILASAWVSTGALAIAPAFRRRREDDSLGFMAASAVPLFLAGSYGVSGITAAFGDGWTYPVLGLLGFSIWGVIVAALALVASWPEPPPITEVHDEDGGAG